MTRYIYEIEMGSYHLRVGRVVRTITVPDCNSLIDGIMLINEGSRELHEDECFEDACDKLRRTFNRPEMRFAEVVDGKVVSFGEPMLYLV